MAQPVWVLSVDLQTKTATFQSGMADAAKAAKSSFGEIKQGATEMASETSGSMTEARHGVMLLGEEFGVHLPRGITTFLASLGPVAATMEAAFPFLAIAVGATMLLEHLSKLHEAANKTAGAWKKVGDVGADAFESMHEKLIDAEIKADELAGDHLDALTLKLEKIDHATMKDLVSELNKIAGSADTAFAGLEHNWFIRLMMGDADVGPAKQQLQGMIEQIDKLRQGGGKAEDVQKLIGGDLQTVKSDMDGIWNRLEEAKKNLATIGDGREFAGMRAEAEKTANLAQQEWGYRQKELDTLQEMKRVTGESVKVDQQERKNTATEDAQREAAKQNEIYQKQQEGLDRRAKAEQDFYNREHKAADEAAKKSRETLSQMAEEEARVTESVTKLFMEQAEEKAKIQADLGKEAAEFDLKMGELSIAAEKETARFTLMARLASDQQRLASDIAFADEEYQLQRESLQKQVDALDKSAKDYEVKLKQLQDREKELDRQHENEVAAMEDKALQARMDKLKSFMQRYEQEFAQGFAQVIMGHQSFTQMISRLGDQVVSTMLQTAIQSAMAMDFGKDRQAAAAARDAFLAGWKFPFPANIAMAPALAASAFATAIAFETGGLVPGVGNTDSVPAMLTPGESVLPKQLTERLETAARSDDGGNKPSPHFHAHYSPQIHAIDGASVKGMLDKHAGEFHKAFENHVRKMNR